MLAICKGKVLLIDEAYNLDDNMYGKQVLDTIVEKISGQASEDIAIVMAGYEREMRNMLREQNPGLSSRFDPSSAFYFEDYSNEALMRIFRNKCERDGLYAHPTVLHAAAARLARKRSLPRFGNAREVDILVSVAQAKATKRNAATGDTLLKLRVEDVMDPAALGGGTSCDSRLHPIPFAPSLLRDDYVLRCAGDALAPLKNLYNVDWIREKIVSLRNSIMSRQRDGRPKPNLESYIFVGNSGTGKTTVARVMAEVLSSPEVQMLVSPVVVVKSASDLKGAYVGKAQENVRSAMDVATGGVLFIDEAYDLAGSVYGQEALTQLVNLMTEDTHKNKTMVILAGYKSDIDEMLQGNQGARSRFRQTWEFPDWEPYDCAGFISKRAEQDDIALNDIQRKILRDGFEQLSGFDVEVLQLDRSFKTERQTRPGWANARDVDAVYDKMMAARDDRVAEEAETEPSFVDADVHKAMREMLQHRPEGVSRSQKHDDRKGRNELFAFLNQMEPPPPPQQTQQQTPDIELREPRTEDDAPAMDACGDCAVEDLSAKAEQEEEEAKGDEKQAEHKARREEEDRKLMRRIQEARDEEARRKIELEKKKREALRRISPCPAGYAWRNVGSGWRCAAGGHFVSDAELERYMG